jgi:hypothetical protein
LLKRRPQGFGARIPHGKPVVLITSAISSALAGDFRTYAVPYLRHSHLNAEFHILLDFIVQAYAFIKEPASLKAVKTIFFACAAVFLCPMIFRFPEGHTATLTHGSRGKFHIFN